MSAREWLEANRCPHCPHLCKPHEKYKVRETHDGWRCGGYRSKYWDIPIDYKAVGK